MKTLQKLLLSLILIVNISGYTSCKKTENFQETSQINLSGIEAKFFNSNRTSNAREKMLVDFLVRKNMKDSFVVPTAKLIGYPRWNKTLTKGGASSDSKFMDGDSMQTFYVPFVRESENFVNSAIVFRVSQTDTTFFYKSDSEYRNFDNNDNQINDSAEVFANFFMTLDNAVFGSKTFKIIDTNLFKQNGHIAAKVKLDSADFTPATNLLTTVEYCQLTTITYNDCPYPVCNPDGSCDHCPLCTSSVSWTYCWEGIVDIPSQGGGTGSTGGGGTGDMPTPPCGGPTGRGNAPCPGGGGGGWIPVDDDPPYIAPAIFTNLDITQLSGCLETLLTELNSGAHATLIRNAYAAEHIPYQGTQLNFSAKYFQNSLLTNSLGQPIPASTSIETLPDGTKRVNIILNPTMFVNTTKEYATSIILHELLHGILFVLKPNLTGSTLDATTTNHHLYMFWQNFGTSIAASLKEVYPAMSDYDALALSVAPLTDAYFNTTTNSYFTGADQQCITFFKQNLNSAISTTNNYKTAAANSGTPFCF